ncbi:MAG: hypothetical protein GWO26_28135, partial [Phycisphaerae bacterium]|nr:hypothetical protein [Phycisphaerae bacterium]
MSRAKTASSKIAEDLKSVVGDIKRAKLVETNLLNKREMRKEIVRGIVYGDTQTRVLAAKVKNVLS